MECDNCGFEITGEPIKVDYDTDLNFCCAECVDEFSDNLPEENEVDDDRHDAGEGNDEDNDPATHDEDDWEEAEVEDYEE